MKPIIAYVKAKNAGGSPKGVYATVSALQTAFPTGSNNIYLVTADGNWYYWSGSAWTAGGIYQSTGIADKGITPSMLSSAAGDGLAQLFNMCDYSAITQGYYLGANGAPVSAANVAYSDYIPVTPGDTVCWYGIYSNSFQATAYDSGKVFSKTIYASDLGGAYHAYTYVVPAGVYNIRFNMGTTQSNTMVVKGTTYPATYTPYGFAVLSTNLASGIRNSLNLVVLNTDVNFNTTLGQSNLTNKGNTKYATAVGHSALKSNTTDGTADAGLYNTAVGYAALQNNTIGNHNTAIGFQAAMGITIGTGDTAIGEDALLTETTGVGNTAVGQRALQNSAGANNNTAVGVSAMYWDSTSNVTGSENTAIGHYAGTAITSDTDLTFIGHFANKDTSANVYTNSTAIGANAKVSKSNQMRLGDTNLAVVDTYGDFESLANGKGVVLKDRTTGTRYRVFVNNGAIAIEAA